MFIPDKSMPQNRLAPPTGYRVYGSMRSYFTRKLTAALHFYGVEWQFHQKTQEIAEEIRLRSGTHQVPVLHLPEGWMIADTTPILHLLDGRYPKAPLIGRGARGILIQMVEDYFDEWIARTTVHWRWNYPENHDLLASELSLGDPDLARTLLAWGGKVCRATGVSSDRQKQAAEGELRRLLDAATRQLSETRFLMGDRPTAVDCNVLGLLRAHFFYDPAPKDALYNAYPALVRWVETDADAWSGRDDDDALLEFPETTAFGSFVLQEMGQTYAPFIRGNKAAREAGDKAFIIPIYGEEVSYLARPYIETARQMIAKRISEELSDTEKPGFEKWLDSLGLGGLYIND